MAIELGKALALTAASGLVAGLAACGGQQAEAKDPSAEAGAAPAAEPAAATATDAPAGDKECCKGKNECKGQGQCKTEKNDCAGQNECKGQGGCKAPDCKGA